MMKVKWISVLIVFGSLALLGIIVVQLSWIRNAMDIRQESFNTAVNNALVKTVEKLEKKEDVVYITERLNLEMDSIPPPPPMPQSGLNQDRGVKERFDSVIIIRHTEIENRHEYLPHGGMPPPGSGPDEKKQMLLKEIKRFDRKVQKMNDVIREIIVEVETKDQGIENRLDTFSLQKELYKALLDNGIRIPYEYAVVTLNKAAMMNLRSPNFLDEYLKSAYRISLFPNDLIAEPNYLLVYFPGQKANLMKSMSLLMTASLVFTLTLLIAFVVTILALLRQKKLSEIKTDFINNMTHEFKTPLATISLAVDSINNAKVIGDPGMIRQYTQVIREENNRMNTHVEQVLQMALFDRREFRLDLNLSDLHDIIRRSVESVRLQLEKRQGTVKLELLAENAVIMADEVQLMNCILNLLDNANKYSPEKPEISIYTRNQEKSVILGVSDKGIGMTKETQKRIFEKFYRIPTGNIHNVKGFGLGLSYVKAIVDAHRGTIHVWSETGNGCRIEITLPLPKEDRKTTSHES